MPPASNISSDAVPVVSLSIVQPIKVTTTQQVDGDSQTNGIRIVFTTVIESNERPRVIDLDELTRVLQTSPLFVYTSSNVENFSSPLDRHQLSVCASIITNVGGYTNKERNILVLSRVVQLQDAYQPTAFRFKDERRVSYIAQERVHKDLKKDSIGVELSFDFAKNECDFSIRDLTTLHYLGRSFSPTINSRSSSQEERELFGDMRIDYRVSLFSNDLEFSLDRKMGVTLPAHPNSLKNMGEWQAAGALVQTSKFQPSKGIMPLPPPPPAKDNQPNTLEMENSSLPSLPKIANIAKKKAYARLRERGSRSTSPGYQQRRRGMNWERDSGRRSKSATPKAKGALINDVPKKEKRRATILEEPVVIQFDEKAAENVNATTSKIIADKKAAGGGELEESTSATTIIAASGANKYWLIKVATEVEDFYEKYGVSPVIIPGHRTTLRPAPEKVTKAQGASGTKSKDSPAADGKASGGVIGQPQAITKETVV